MIIVSQEKDTLFPFNRGIHIFQGTVWESSESAVAYRLGSYESDKRAKEVLAEIVDAYHHCNDIFYMPEE